VYRSKAFRLAIPIPVPNEESVLPELMSRLCTGLDCQGRTSVRNDRNWPLCLLASTDCQDKESRYAAIPQIVKKEGKGSAGPPVAIMPVVSAFAASEEARRICLNYPPGGRVW
jgi:hypothetical protein